MLTYKDFNITTRTLVAELLKNTRKVMNDNGDLVWCGNGVVLTTLTAKKLADAGEYDELDGHRIYDASMFETEDWYTRETEAERRADKADYDRDTALNR